MNSPEFFALQAEWYAKLAAEGFDDIERHENKSGYGLSANNPFLRRHKFEVAAVIRRNERVHGETFFRWAGWWRWERTFPNRRAAHVWRAFAAGQTYREAAAGLTAMRSAKPTSCFYAIQSESQLMLEHYADITDDCHDLDSEVPEGRADG